MAATDHTRLRTARADARKNSGVSNRGGARHKRAAPLLGRENGVSPKVIASKAAPERTRLRDAFPTSARPISDFATQVTPGGIIPECIGGEP
jgi:hypothetical protein